MSLNTFTPDYAVPPGSILEEYMQCYKITGEEMANHIGVSVKDLALLLKGELPMTHRIARKLFQATDINENMWMNLENLYRKQLGKGYK